MPESGQTLSLWQAQVRPRPTTPLEADARCDACVIGAGIAGLTTAYLLAREGRSVVVIDDGHIGGGATLRTTAHLSNALDDRYAKLERWHGPEGARLAAHSHGAAIDTVERIVQQEGIDCDFRRIDGWLVAGDEKGRDTIEQELAAARRAGIEVELGRVPAGHDFGTSLRFPRQARFHAGRYLDGLATASQRLGVRIASPMHMTGIADGKPARVQTSAGVRIECDHAIVATNTPVIDRLLIHTKQAAYRTYVIAMRIARGDAPDVLLWDTLDPYHYVRVQQADEHTDWLIVGGEDHKTGQPDDPDPADGAPFERLHAWTRERFPTAGAAEFRWSGQVLEPHDGLAFIGRNPMDANNVYVATGDSGNGLTHGTIAGMLITDLVMGRDNPWATLYDPSRKSLLTAGTFLKENLNFASQYKDFATPGEVDDAALIEPGQGALLRRGATKHALYRDTRGELHELSAVCPHLGCLVHWNGVEKTWDCPCHGSRFAAEDGHVLNGPANRGLTVIESFRATG